MPCRGPEPEEQYAYELKTLVPLLCEACELLEDTGALKKASPALLEWYKDHTAREEDRVRYEAALKLSERERRLLNINLSALKAQAQKKCSG